MPDFEFLINECASLAAKHKQHTVNRHVSNKTNSSKFFAKVLSNFLVLISVRFSLIPYFLTKLCQFTIPRKHIAHIPFNKTDAFFICILYSLLSLLFRLIFYELHRNDRHHTVSFSLKSFLIK